jgi:hypothetical protein
MKALRDRVPRQSRTPEVHVSLMDDTRHEDPEMGVSLHRKRSTSSVGIMQDLPGPAGGDDHKYSSKGDGATLSSLHFTASRRSDLSAEFDGQYDEEEDSPYPEVRASVSNIDDIDMPTLTFRVWFIGQLLCWCIKCWLTFLTIGMILCMSSAGANTFFNFRYPAPSLMPLIML